MKDNDTVKSRVDRISANDNLFAEYQPTSVKVEVCGKCTLSCKFCFQTQMKSLNIRQKVMSQNDFDKVIQFLKSVKSVKEVGLFYMGESALNNNLASYYKQLKESGYFTYLTTNGTLLKNVLESIPYIDSLKVSWNYASIDDFFSKTGSTREMFNAIKSNISKFYDECHKNDKRLTVSTVLDRSKEEYMAELSTLKFDDNYFLPLQTQCGLNDSGVGGVVGQYDAMRNQIPCWSLFKCLYIDCDLNVRTCCYGHHDCHVLYNINDTHEYKLDEKELKMRKLQLKNVIPSECIKCITQR